jgi:hypothetical protein
MLTAGSLVMSVPVYAEDISGSVTLKVTKQDVLPLTAQSGDMLMLVESHGTNKSSNWMDDAEVVNKEVDSLLQGNGPQHGYITFVKGGIPSTSSGADSWLPRWPTVSRRSAFTAPGNS